ncbi:hypothetical protein O181_100018 [Austropuccinia psidii MF-1]|uniref:Uncharacterized protein n=1 Tax=Austropuccinia psidii MF-1 TaxID=1389203 RepID=A0A9Q3JBZ2_9BASI|nr:hypothetical protein [Austropuccinia psidii MF-1]
MLEGELAPVHPHTHAHPHPPMHMQEHPHTAMHTQAHLHMPMHTHAHPHPHTRRRAADSTSVICKTTILLRRSPFMDDLVKSNPPPTSRLAAGPL